MEISNSLAIVTGGASGAGQATAKLLSSLGATVALFDIDESKMGYARDIEALPMVVDVTQADPVEKAFESLKKTCSYPLRIVVNCAGIAPPSRMTGKEGFKPLSFFEKVIQVNLIGTYNVMRVAAHYLSKQEKTRSEERGVIINTASIAAFDGQIGQTAYSASKAGIVGMTLPAARELAQFGIRVMTIAPGLLETPMLQGLPAEIREHLEQTTPFPKRFGKPEEFAKLVQSIVENPMLNGEVIRLDGALRMP